MSNQLISSYDKLISSNLIKIETIPLSPINAIYNPIDNIQTPLNFNSNDNFLKKKRNSQFSYYKDNSPILNNPITSNFNFMGNINLNQIQKIDFNSSLIPFPDIINQVKIDYQNNFNSNFFEALDSQNLFFEESSINKIIFLDQIKVKGTFLKYFPLISIGKEGKCISINTKIEKKGLFEIIPFNLKKSKEIFFTWSYISNSFITEIIEKYNLFQLKNYHINNFDDLIIHLFNELRRSIQSIQVNFLHQKRQELNECLLNKTQDIIITINEISEDAINYLKKSFPKKLFDEEKKEIKELKKSGKKNLKRKKRKYIKKNRIKKEKLNNNQIKLKNNMKNLLKESNEESDSNSEDDEDFTLINKKNKKINMKTNIIFNCPFCKKNFINGCALGGHMSRVHPHQSQNYQKKIKTREEREEFREAIYQAKKIIVEKYGMDFQKLILDKNGKIKIKNLIHINKKEYYDILYNIKIQKGLPVKENLSGKERKKNMENIHNSKEE